VFGNLSISSLSVLPFPVNRRVGIHDFTFWSAQASLALGPARLLPAYKGRLFRGGRAMGPWIASMWTKLEPGFRRRSRYAYD
jgi:hypothetical protein